MELATTADTTALSYWLNWRFLLCAIWVFTPMVVAVLLLFKYEDLDYWKFRRGGTQEDIKKEFCGDEGWRPCLKVIHPLWLMAYRVTAFFLLLAILIAKVFVSGGAIYYYYTQWTFTLLTIYFGFGSLLSIYGSFWCYKTRAMGLGVQHVRSDAENGTYVLLQHEENNQEENYILPVAVKCSYVFQAIFQTNAGAVMLTDCIYWLVIFPFLNIKDYKMSALTVSMHSVNAVLLLGDAMLNCLQVPFVRMSLVVLWTGAFVTFQWIIHACISIWWPYPFLDLSSPYAPVWYLMVGLMHIPCYAFFTLIVGLKRHLLSKWFPHSCQC
ncbi:uncharacterized protein LOC126798182 [Argentina anserina]|uniref:uncharacterized protein LOC126798182 n=1 Tax=Argentina anserina TaxID=57926 RepID=UPI0021764702|nr:uncharacterized protein LOC126798182 [Potentilla anserina]XP_050381015.1 uncharacterized protein LOC126798182 [Potentilla anserina]XP_050381016.1 uncharacterized protein LOC126798182 [Potentilla anserina]